MHHAFAHQPVSTTLDLVLDAGESVVVQPGSMQLMDTGFTIATSAGGALARRGIGGSFRSVLAGESLVRVVYTAKRDGQRLSLAPSHMGDLVALPLEEGGWYVSRGAWLASTPEVELAVRYAGVKGWMANTGLFLLHATGAGTVFCAGFGAIARRELAEGERVLLDNRFVVAFRDTVTFELVTLTKELGTAALSGEGLVNRYTGPGTVVYQTRGAQRGGGLLSLIAQTIF